MTNVLCKLDGTELLNMLKLASMSLKYPKIVMQLANHKKVKFYVAGNGNNAGGINIVDEKPYPDNAYYGKITPNGVVHLTTRASQDQMVADAICAVLSSPVSALKANGQKYGYCCFCARELTYHDSVAVGYGPICAEKFGLPWGDSSTAEDKPATLPEI